MKPWAAVIGSPIQHSLSPVLHSCAFELADLDWDFRRVEVTGETLPLFMEGLDSQCVGLAITMPCKQSVIPFLDTVDALAKNVGAVNTCVVAGGLLAGFNTDVHGIVETIRDEMPGRSITGGSGKKAVILGTGATASSALAALTSLKFDHITVIGRSFAGAGNVLQAGSRLGADFDPLLWHHSHQVERVCHDTDILISTIPPHATEGLAQALEVCSNQLLLDVTYGSGTSPLTTSFRKSGGRVLSPLRMLAYQGLAQDKLWSGIEVPFEPVYRAIENAA